MKTNTDKLLGALNREDTLSSWRLASLLAFNGFLLAGYAGLNENGNEYLVFATPIMGLVISLSVLAVAIKSSCIKFLIYQDCENGQLAPSISPPKSIVTYCIAQFFGPYIFSAVILVLFWIGTLLFQ